MKQNTNVSAVVLTANESDTIVNCLSSLLWCDEIIIIDNSRDSTVELAKKNVPPQKLRIYYSTVEDFSVLRNKGLSLARKGWVFFVDADEIVSKQLSDEIREKLPLSTVDAYSIERQDFFLGRWMKHGEARQRFVKLGRKTIGVWNRSVHEKWTVDKVDKLKNPLWHFPHPTVLEFLERINRWTELDAKEFYRQGNRSSFPKIIVYPVAKFIKNFFFAGGFLDGIPGLILALMMSFHSFLTRAKLYQLQVKNNV